MLNSFNSFSGGRLDLQKRIYKKFKASMADEQMKQTIQKNFEEFLFSENIILSRPERQKLFNQGFKMLLEEMLEDLDNKLKS